MSVGLSTVNDQAKIIMADDLIIFCSCFHSHDETTVSVCLAALWLWLFSVGWGKTAGPDLVRAES